MTTVVVNGVSRELQAPADTPLLYVLRNDLELSGPQFGCGLAQCGACSVLLDGKEIRSCITPLSAAAGKEVTTLEGLPARWAQQKGLSKADAEKTLHPVQQAWIEEQTPLCGFCQNGMMIKATELLERIAYPDRRAKSKRRSRPRVRRRISAAAEATPRSSKPCSAPPRSWRRGGKRWQPSEKPVNVFGAVADAAAISSKPAALCSSASALLGADGSKKSAKPHDRELARPHAPRVPGSRFIPTTPS